jgi:hypothetical protein
MNPKIFDEIGELRMIIKQLQQQQQNFQISVGVIVAFAGALAAGSFVMDQLSTF